MYCNNNTKIDLLNVFLIKELRKHWIITCLSLNRLSRPNHILLVSCAIFFDVEESVNPCWVVHPCPYEKQPVGYSADLQLNIVFDFHFFKHATTLPVFGSRYILHINVEIQKAEIDLKYYFKHVGSKQSFRCLELNAVSYEICFILDRKISKDRLRQSPSIPKNYIQLKRPEEHKTPNLYPWNKKINPSSSHSSLQRPSHINISSKGTYWTKSLSFVIGLLYCCVILIFNLKKFPIK